MWAFGRRTGLFIVSYVPLAAMFAALRWPQGWRASRLVELAVVMVALAGLVLFVPALIAVTGPVARWVVRGVGVAALGIVLLGVFSGWLTPMALTAPLHKSTALVSGIGVFFAALGLLIVGLLLYNARRVGEVEWTISDTREQGAAVAGYLASYLLPLLAIQPGGWRVAAAYGIYLAILYIVYVSSDSLVLINPTLYCLRYRIYEAETKVSTTPPTTRRVLLLTKRRLEPKDKVNVLPLGGDNHLAT